MVEVAVEIGDPEPLAGAVTYHRHDLAFAADGARARAVHGGHPGNLAAILELALAAALPDGLLLHAAAGVIGDGAWLMPGRSGTGKSTAVRAGNFDRVLSDERVVVRRRGDGFVAWGTPWWSEGRRHPLDAGSAPVAGLVALHHGGPWWCPWPKDAAAAGLVESVTLYETRPAARAAAFERACDLAEAVETIELAFRPGADWTAPLLCA